MIKNKDFPDCCTPGLVTLSLSLSLPRRLGPIKAGLTCLLLPTLFILRVPPGSCQGWTPAVTVISCHTGILNTNLAGRGSK